MDPAPPNANPVPIRILVVDDDAPTLRMVEFILESEGYQVAAAPNGALGLAHCQAALPDLLLLNVLLPDSDGFEIYDQLRTLGYPGPVIFMTARPDIPEVLENRQLEVVGCLVKPLHPEDVLALVGRTLAPVEANPLPSTADS